MTAPKREKMCGHCEEYGAERSMQECPFCGHPACMKCRVFIKQEQQAKIRVRGPKKKAALAA